MEVAFKLGENFRKLRPIPIPQINKQGGGVFATKAPGRP